MLLFSDVIHSIPLHIEHTVQGIHLIHALMIIHISSPECMKRSVVYSSTAHYSTCFAIILVMEDSN